MGLPKNPVPSIYYGAKKKKSKKSKKSNKSKNFKKSNKISKKKYIKTYTSYF